MRSGWSLEGEREDPHSFLTELVPVQKAEVGRGVWGTLWGSACGTELVTVDRQSVGGERKRHIHKYYTSNHIHSAERIVNARERCIQ